MEFLAVAGQSFVFAGLVLGTITAFFRYKKEKLSRKLLEKELAVEVQTLDFSEILNEWGSTEEELRRLLRDTSIDRFMILRAWNGILEPKWTTAVYQLRAEGQDVYSYIHVKLDDDYVTKLRETILHGFSVYSVSNMEPSIIKDIYETEGVKSAIWSHIISKADKESKTKAITYCSFASHTESELDTNTVTRCRMIANRLTGLALGLVKDAE